MGGKILRLAFGAREGVVVCRIWSKGGGWRLLIGGKPLLLMFGAREGVLVVCQQRKYPLLVFRAREGVLVVCQQRKHPLLLMFRVREGVEMVDVRG
jgi:hypothetical protein